jgi:hypothetical protein
VGRVDPRWWCLSRREVAGFVGFCIALAVFGSLWTSQPLRRINDNKAAVCASVTALTADRRSDAVTSDQLGSRAQEILEQAELGRDRQLTELVSAYGRALSNGDPVRIQQVEASFEQRCDSSTDR